MSSALEKYVTEFMISKNDSSESAVESAENIISCKLIYTSGDVSTALNMYTLVINNDNQQKDVKTNLLNLIQCLGQYLVHEDDTIRAKGKYQLDAYLKVW